MSIKLPPTMKVALNLTRNGDLAGAVRAIQQALSAPEQQTVDGTASVDLEPSASSRQGSSKEHPNRMSLGGDAFGRARTSRPLSEVIEALGRLKHRVFDNEHLPLREKRRAPQVPPGARFETRSVGGVQGDRWIKVYIPARPLAEPRSLLIMLHGCTQSPDDFAAGTRMNQLAEEKGFVVAYPAQPKSANPSSCWNWFNPANQTRGTGESEVIAALARGLTVEFGIDPKRVFVAGMSAGGAMAAIMAATNPDVFSGVGIHSGLPFRSASDVVSALAAMRGQGPAVLQQNVAIGSVPTIVFHGSADRVVHPSNGARIVNAHHGGWQVERGNTNDGKGRSFQRMINRDAGGHVKAEYWVIEGGGHAWSGGSPDGSFVDPLGPDASREMVRFFFAQ